MILLQVAMRVVFGAMLFRGQGGVFNHIACWMAGRNPTTTTLVSATEARVLYAVLMVTLQIDQMTLTELGMVAGALFIGALPGWPTPVDASQRGAMWQNFLLLALRGLWFTAPAGAVLFFLGQDWWFGLVGLSLAVCYLIAEFIPSDIPLLRRGRELGVPRSAASRASPLP
jgi:hypothetical protein